MNSKQVLDRIVSMLSLTKKEEEVAMTYARLADGTIVESPTFDVGEPVEVVSEDGTKTPAPDGTHELVLKDTEGNEVPFKVITKDGKIVERENIELEIKETEPIPSATMEPEANKVPDPKSPASNDKGLKPSSMLAEVDPLPTGDGIEGTPEPLPGEEGSPFDMKKFEDMAYRIEELEKKVAKMAEAEVEIEVEKDVEEELPKLDGAPIDEMAKFSAMKPKNKLKEGNAQGSFLEKLYN
jgi:hypothetical protein